MARYTKDVGSQICGMARECIITRMETCLMEHGRMIRERAMGVFSSEIRGSTQANL